MTTSIAWWESTHPSGVYEFTLDIDERDLEKLELAMLNGSQPLQQGFFKLRLVDVIE